MPTPPGAFNFSTSTLSALLTEISGKQSAVRLFSLNWMESKASWKLAYHPLAAPTFRLLV